MFMATNQRALPDIDIRNSQKRCPLVLVLDVSYSMEGNPIQQLNDGLKVLKQELLKDDTAKNSVDMAIVTFGGAVELAHDFATVEAFNPPTLVATDNTPMGEAIEYALQILEERQDQYKNYGFKCYKPWVWLITDGCPNDDSPWQEAAQKLLKTKKIGGKDEFKVFFCAVAVEGADINMLGQIAQPDNPPVLLNALDFKTMFKWLSMSIGSQAQGQVKLEPLGWGSRG
jgi:uncharacterized protein YegL